MAMNVNNFQRIASTNAQSDVIEIKNASGENRLKASGFWGRLVNKAGKDVQVNQATMREFAHAIGDEYGSFMMNRVKEQLNANSGTPLTARKVRDTLEWVRSENANLKAKNELALHEYMADKFDAQVTRLFNIPLGAAEKAELARHASAMVELSTLQNNTLTPKDLEAAMRKTFSDRASLDEHFMRDVENLFIGGYGHLSGGELAALRPQIFTTAKSVDEIKAGVEIMRFVENRLPRLENMRTSAEMIGFLEDLAVAVSTAQKRHGVNPASANSANFGIQAAFLHSGISPEAKLRIADAFSGDMAWKVTAAMYSAIDSSPREASTVTTLGSLATLENGIKWSGAAPLSLMLRNENMPDNPPLSRELRNWIAVSTSTDSRVHKELAFLNGTNLDSADRIRLIMSLGPPPADGDRYTFSLGVKVLASYIDELKALQPDDKPFTLETVRKALKLPPAHAEGAKGRLAIAASISYDELFDRFLIKNGDKVNMPTEGRRDYMGTYLEAGFNAAKFFDLALTEPREKKLGLADFLKPPVSPLNPQRTRTTIVGEISRDYARASAGQVVTVGNDGFVIGRDRETNPEPADPEMRARVTAPRKQEQTEPVATAVERYVQARGGSRAQELGTLELLHQGAFASMMFGLGFVNVERMHGMSAHTLAVEWRDGVVAVVVDSLEGNDPRFHFSYEVDREGTSRLVEFDFQITV